MKTCSKCGVSKPDESFKPLIRDPTKRRAKCIRCDNRRYVNRHRAPPSEKLNRLCSAYIGHHAAKEVLSNIFKCVRRMPHNNSGCDYICDNEVKIDVMSRCMINCVLPSWSFKITNHIRPDYYMFVAFGTRADLNLLHIWMVPGMEIDIGSDARITDNMLSKWAEYEISGKKVVQSCNALKDGMI